MNVCGGEGMVGSIDLDNDATDFPHSQSQLTSHFHTPLSLLPKKKADINLAELTVRETLSFAAAFRLK